MPATRLPLLLLSLLVAAAPVAAEPLALHCGQLFDAGSARMLGAHSIVVRDGRIAVVEGGRVRLDDRPGIGFEGKAAFHRVLRELHH